MHTLHKKFVSYGRDRKKLTNKMLAILPEIYKKKIYLRYAPTIHEYACKYGGLSYSSVTKRLRLEAYLKDKPKLSAAIEEVGLNKVDLVARIATSETDAAFATKISNLSKAAVELLSRELRDKVIDKPTVCKAKTVNISLELDEEDSFLFLKLKKKLGPNLSNKAIMKMILTKLVSSEFPESLSTAGPTSPTSTRANTATSARTAASTSARTAASTSAQAAASTSAQAAASTSAETNKPIMANRYINVKTRREALANSDQKCGYPGCNRPPDTFHHRDRYSEAKNHDSIIPLCSAHHEFMHAGLVSHENSPLSDWKLNLNGKPDRADALYLKYRQESLL